jgi:hypothetical protein
MKNELPSFSLNFFALSILDSHLNYRTTEQILFAHLNGNELFIPRNSENCSELFRVYYAELLERNFNGNPIEEGVTLQSTYIYRAPQCMSPR